MKPFARIAALALILGLAGPAHADLTPAAAAFVAATIAAPVSATVSAPVSATAGAEALSPTAYDADADSFVVMKEVRVVAKRGDSERKALTAAAQQALDEARLRHWKLNNVTVRDLVQSIIREEDLSAFQLGKARIESVTQERMDNGTGGQEAWKCRLVLSLRRK